jgi:hypothetical protein
MKNTKFVKDLLMIDAQLGSISAIASEINIGPYGEHVSKRFFYETTWTIETNLPRNDHWKVLYKALFFMPIEKPIISRRPSNEHACTVWLFFKSYL